MSGTLGNGNVAAERQLGAEVKVIVPSWGSGKLGWEMAITTAAIMRLVTGTEIELRGGSELKQSLLKICQKKEEPSLNFFKKENNDEKHARTQYGTRPSSISNYLLFIFVS